MPERPSSRWAGSPARYPALVREIVAQGHELASHGSSHLRASEQSRAEFHRDIEERAQAPRRHRRGGRARVSRAKLLDRPRQPVGLRVPRRGRLRTTAPACIRCGTTTTACRTAPRFAYRTRERRARVAHHHHAGAVTQLPAGGGGFFRLLPYQASRWAIARVNRVDRQPAIFYFHPWEIDPHQPRIAGVSAKTRFRHYLNLDRTESRLDRLLSDFRWDRIDRVFEIDQA